MKPTYTDGTEITETKLQRSRQHLLQYVGDKTAKKNQEYPANRQWILIEN